MRPSKRPHLAVLLLVLLMTLSACSREVRYKTLTFFFTGVPPLDYKPPVQVQQQGGADLTAMQRYNLDRLVAASQRPQYSGSYTHGPFASNNCEVCHQLQTESGIGFSGGADDKPGVNPTEFQAPREELCTGCHTSKGAKAVAAAGLRLHGPAISDCTLCHNHHASPEQYFLDMALDKLCQQCHAAGFIHAAELHADAGPCLDCHNAHMGKDARMLNDDYHEVY